MPRQPDPIPVLHPAPVVAVPREGMNPRRTFVAATSPVRLRRRDPDEFTPLASLAIGRYGAPRRLYSGPGGIWQAVPGPLAAPAPLPAVRAWLCGERIEPRHAKAIARTFSGTPLAAYGKDCDPDQAWEHPAFRGHAGGEAGRIVREDAMGAAAILQEWLDREVALVDRAALVRFRPVAALKPLRSGGWNIVEQRYGGGFDLVAATPRTFRAVDAVWGREGRRAMTQPPQAWADLAGHWPEPGDEDIRYILNMQAAHLSQRIARRLDALRTRTPGHDSRDALDRIVPPLSRMAHRAALGRAGAPGHEDDLDLFREAVALEARLAGRAASRTGISVLNRYLAEVVGPRALALPGDDGDALGGLVPGR